MSVLRHDVRVNPELGVGDSETKATTIQFGRRSLSEEIAHAVKLENSEE